MQNRLPVLSSAAMLATSIALVGCGSVPLPPDTPPDRVVASTAPTPATPPIVPAATVAPEPAAEVAVPTPVPASTVVAEPLSTGGAAPAAPVAASAPAPAPVRAPGIAVEDDPALESRFAAWVAAFRASARAAGIDDATLSSAFDGVQRRPRVVELDRSQPEFTRAVWDYVDAIVSPERLARGQARWADARQAADDAAARHGVPAAVLVAVWGIESDFGRLPGDVPTIDALATLGFEGRREEWARRELMAALKILQHGDIDRAHMVGSWAGAMGQTQLMPTSYLRFAEDADGDGRRDIWGDLPDVLASTANMLARSGWQSTEPWGLEARLPEGFDVSRADPAVRQSSARWNDEGVRTMDGAPLPAMADAAILLPAGARGPAFLVGGNFRAILAYNNATSYALAVGLLSQRLAGGPGVQAAWPRDLVPLTRSQVVALQQALNAKGFDSGTPDGVAGPATRDALRRWQRSAGLVPDGYPTAEALAQLQR